MPPVAFEDAINYFAFAAFAQLQFLVCVSDVVDGALRRVGT